jgi:hypothetical protein
VTRRTDFGGSELADLDRSGRERGRKSEGRTHGRTHHIVLVLDVFHKKFKLDCLGLGRKLKLGYVPARFFVLFNGVACRRKHRPSLLPSRHRWTSLGYHLLHLLTCQFFSLQSYLVFNLILLLYKSVHATTTRHMHRIGYVPRATVLLQIETETR